MAVAFDAASTAKGTTGSFTFSHTCTGSNLILTVGVAINAAASATVNAVTYNGVALTKVDSIANSISSDLWYLVGPATGAHSIVVALSASGAMTVCNAASYTGVSQSTPLGTKVTASGNSNTPSVTVTSATGQLVVDSVAQNSANGTATLTAGSGQTQRGNDRQFSAFGVIGAMSEEAGAASVVMDWSGSNSTTWATIGVPLKPVTGASVTGSSSMSLTDSITTAGLRGTFGVASMQLAFAAATAGLVTPPPTRYYRSMFIDRRHNRIPRGF
jgi:hypothetical protein